jgi:hypothetical protein
MPDKPSQIQKPADSLGIWHKVSIAMRRPRSGRGAYFGIGPRRDLCTSLARTLSRLVAERHYSWVEGYMEWLEGKGDDIHEAFLYLGCSLICFNHLS